MFLKRVMSIITINVLSIVLMFSVMLNINPILLILVFGFISFIFFIKINIMPIKDTLPNKRLYTMYSGCELLKLFLISLVPTIIIQIGVLVFLLNNETSSTVFYSLFIVVGIINAIINEAIIFWNGIIRVYATSIQLGMKHRVLGIVFGWILGLNIYYLTKIIKICSNEVEFETQKIELNEVRVESEICKTTYPILLVHGVFFRDFRYLNYWGRIPKELQKNGATIYYGEQESAGTVEANGQQLSKRIKSIVEETGCRKINIIAHSKGGLDSRMAITHFGAEQYVATLTTINTPHNGCVFAEYLMNKMPNVIKNNLAKSYNSALKKLGDKSPDFIGAVNDLTASSCIARNEITPNSENVLYESVMSYCKKSNGGKFPLNFSYFIVKYFDGKNDGLVSIESSKWGSSFTLLEPKGKRGISHGDIIDLNRENIDGFDVREFYVNLVSSLRNKGY